MGTYGLTEAQQRGIKAEENIIPELIKSMESNWDCKVSIERSSQNVNMKDKIDFSIVFYTKNQSSWDDCLVA